MPHRPFRFGVSIGSATDRRTLVETIRQAEDSGFHVLTGVDHIGPPLGVLPMLATVAELSTLRIATMVIANDYRHPVILAKDAATIDLLSEGRLELGLGTGWIRAQYESAGLEYDSARVRVDRLEEAVEVIKGCWTARPFVFRGSHYEVDLIGSPAPIQPGGPPLLIGASGPRMLRLGARHADIVGITVTRGQSGFSTFLRSVALSAGQMPRQLEILEEEAGDRFSEIELNVLIHYVESDSSKAREMADEADVSFETFAGSPHALVGSVEAMADSLREARDRYGITYVAFRGADLATAGRVVERLSGT
jgi:probable F420-dependent oxidoreductase